MGLFSSISNYRKNRRFKSFEKLGAVLMNSHTTKDQRNEAIDALAKGNPEEIIPQLLKRFELVVDHGLQDQKEKERVFELIKSHGDAGRDYAVNGIKKARRITWFMKLCKHFLSEDEFVELLVSMLEPEASSFDDMAHEKNREILLNLKDFPKESLLVVIEPFLEHRDNDIQMAALECLEGMASSLKAAQDKVKELASMELNDDNSRFVGQVQSILKRHEEWN